LKDVLDEEKIAQVVAIGPVPMMKFVSELTKEYNVPTLVSLNPIMVDGTGMCGGCRVTVGGKTMFACVDGPEFDGHQVDFDELTLRLQAYHEEEKICYNEFCRMEALRHNS
jgi:ferredoxin--NADP+ reductase